ncbi:monovalent cation/H+ antiporter complex subunit F [Naasia sp. SYSU D00057]|uniref:monovalent cation/H+ antiporter complex subunit F n=1 Tax=Naasia sp. SYSU D00057 TaxID=2817380 RepID=UPI001B3125F9|nr:monovalent cation/H+ antiporter complex subunit F [Naasia sp. SYSU D00057]
MTLVDILHLIAGVLFAGAAFLVLLRILRGPSIIDRMVSSDVLVTLVMLALIADMVANHHTRSIPLVLALAGTAVLGAIAVARYVSKHDRRSDGERGALQHAPRGRD